VTINITAAIRNSMLTAINTAANAGSGAAKLRIYDGTKATNADTAVGAQVLLAEITLADPAFETASGGTMDIDANPDVSDTSANATGTATWARLVDSDNNAVYDGTVGTSGTDFIISNTSITSGQTVTLVSGTLTLPA
jgi:hypothetical protein